MSALANDSSRPPILAGIAGSSAHPELAIGHVCSLFSFFCFMKQQVAPHPPRGNILPCSLRGGNERERALERPPSIFIVGPWRAFKLEGRLVARFKKFTTQFAELKREYALYGFFSALTGKDIEVSGFEGVMSEQFCGRLMYSRSPKEENRLF